MCWSVDVLCVEVSAVESAHPIRKLFFSTIIFNLSSFFGVSGLCEPSCLRVFVARIRHQVTKTLSFTKVENVNF